MKAARFRFVALLPGDDLYFQYPHGDEVYNVIAVYEAEDVQGTPVVNDDEGLELKYFSLDEPIPNLNRIGDVILKKAGYL